MIYSSYNFYLLHFSQGESIMGEFQMLQNPRDPERPLFSINVRFEGLLDSTQEKRIYSLFR